MNEELKRDDLETIQGGIETQGGEQKLEPSGKAVFSIGGDDGEERPERQRSDGDVSRA